MKAERTACRRGLFGTDPETGGWRLPPVLCADDWPQEKRVRKGTLTPEQIAEWLAAVRHTRARSPAATRPVALGAGALDPQYGPAYREHTGGPLELAGGLLARV